MEALLFSSRRAHLSFEKKKCHDRRVFAVMTSIGRALRSVCGKQTTVCKSLSFVQYKVLFLFIMLLSSYLHSYRPPHSPETLKDTLFLKTS